MDEVTITLTFDGSKRPWTEIEPKDATQISLPHPEIQGPRNEVGQECPWPWDPIQLVGAPLGQYHCPYCGAMVIAGMDHIDYSEDPPPLHDHPHEERCPRDCPGRRKDRQ